MNLVTILGRGIEISIFLTVLSLGIRASLSDIVYLFRRPRQLIRALTSIYVIMPVFAILLVKNLNLNPLIKVALVALSVSPIPALFPKKVFKSRDEASISFGLLAAVSLLSIIAIPLAFVLFDAVFIRETYYSESWIIQTILTKVLLPMAIGMALRCFAPANLSDRFGGIIAKIGEILLIVSVLPIVIFILPEMWSLIGRGTLLALILFALVGATAGYFLGGPDRKGRTVLALATTSRHPGIAIALASANLGDTPKEMVAAAVILYLIVSAIVVAPFLKRLSGDQAGEKAASGKAA